MNIKVLSYKTNTIENITNTITQLGLLFNNEEKSKELVSNINKNLDSLKSIVENKKILIVISPKNTLSNEIYITGNFIYFEDIIKASGNKNAYNSSNSAQPVVNTEKIINMNPDIIVLLAPYYDGKTKELEDLKRVWAKLPINASKQNNIYAIDKDYAGIPSHRVEYFINDFRKILEDVRNK